MICARVISSRFEDLPQVEREGLVRRHLDQALTAEERARVFFITETREEREAMQREWADRWRTQN
jgi:hypothetical protein